MKNSRLFQALSTLDTSEWRAFHKYLASPYFNRRSDLPALATALQREMDRPSPDKAAVWKKAFPGKPFDEKEMRYCMSYLLEACESFLALSAFQENPALQRLSLAEALNRRGLASPRTGAQEAPAGEPALERLLLRQQRELDVRQGVYSPDAVRRDQDRFTEAMLVETLREGCAFLDLEPAGGDFPWLQTTLEFCERQSWAERSPSVDLLYHSYRMMESLPAGDGSEAFFQVKKLLEEQRDISTDLCRECWLRAVNFAIRRRNQGIKTFGRQAFELYRWGIAGGLVLNNGQITKKAYSNILVLALLEGEWTWAERFLSDYRQFLPEQERDNAYRHNLATLYFKQGQFEKVLQSLQSVAFTDSLHNLDDRRLLLCSYYELGEWAALDSLLDSFGIWLRRAKNLGYHRDHYANLVKFTRRLVDQRRLDAGARSKLRQEIEACNNVAAREWLLEKLG